MRRPGRRAVALSVAAYLGCAAVAALVTLPLALERAVEESTFTDTLATLPVQVRLVHNGTSELDTGVFGTVYWDQTGAFGFGARARVTGPPQAGGSLASYADARFIQANTALINDPNVVVRAYAAEFSRAFRAHVVRDELVFGVLGGALLLAVVPWKGLRNAPRGRALLVSGVLVVGATGVSAVAAARMFDGWPGSHPVAGTYPMPGVDRLSFDNPEALEVAQQIKPFIAKNTQRIEQQTRDYEARALESFRTALAQHAAGLAPRDGEVVVLAEADPQGSFVGTNVRTALYADLVPALGADRVVLRTLSGDITSNGTVAESSFVAAEARVAPDVPSVAVGGDHDSETTWDQLEKSGLQLPDLTTTEVGGLLVSGANDREHKALFGALVSNRSGISEQELGARLRAEVDERPGIVVLHQPDAAAGYLGLDSLAPVRALGTSDPEHLTTPYDDGIPDQVPGIVSIGHLHQTDGPWVLWNTDGGSLTWTVVDQLGTSGGVENHPTFNRFSTPVSVPLRPISVRLQYLDSTSGLQTGYATLTCSLDAECRLTGRTDVGLPGGQPLDVVVGAQDEPAGQARGQSTGPSGSRGQRAGTMGR